MKSCLELTPTREDVERIYEHLEFWENNTSHSLSHAETASGEKITELLSKQILSYIDPIEHKDAILKMIQPRK